MYRIVRRAVVVALWAVQAVAAASVQAELRLPAVISDNMVLQRGIKAPVWGTAEPGEKVSVALGARKVVATSDAQGRWLVRLGPLAAGGPFELTITAGADSRTVRNVMVGEVWIASGQSNMEWPLAAARNPDYEIAQANYPKIRLFNVTKAVSQTPAADCKGAWAECAPQTARSFSAVAYFFGRALYRRLQIPIGLIETAWGGTPAESWTPRKWLEADPITASMLSRIPTAEQEASATRGGQPAWNAWTPTGLYNGMIAPIVPYGIAGAIWYQGESNAGRAYQYRTLFPAMIRSWREAWNQGDFPFVWVQLANFTKRLPEPAESDWAELREAQTMTLALPKTGQAVIIDIGEADDIHPRNKQDVGQRLAIQAQAIAYGDADLPSSGPTYKSMVVKAGKAIVTFANTAGGLESRDQMPIGGFAVAGTDRKFVWAEARISGSTVLVSSPSVPEPVAVRYGWANNPNCNLYNSAGLPAGPFRTDDWPGVTVDKR